MLKPIEKEKQVQGKTQTSTMFRKVSIILLHSSLVNDKGLGLLELQPLNDHRFGGSYTKKYS